MKELLCKKCQAYAIQTSIPPIPDKEFCLTLKDSIAPSYKNLLHTFGCPMFIDRDEGPNLQRKKKGSTPPKKKET